MQSPGVVETKPAGEAERLELKPIIFSASAKSGLPLFPTPLLIRASHTTLSQEPWVLVH
jgi:hypothetical protein